MPSYRVPFSSQFTDLGHHEWRARGCGVTSLKMVMDYWHDQNSANTTGALEDVLDTGLRVGAYIPGIGWSHKGLVHVAQLYGYDAFNIDVAPNSPTPKSIEEAWSMVRAELDRGPVMVSVFAGFDPARKGGHIVVLCGVDAHVVYLNDPEEMTAREGQKVLAIEAFLRAFKLRSIVIRPR